MAFQLVTPPAVEPLSVSEVKTHLRIIGTDDDTYLGTLIQSARERAEPILNRALITQTWKLLLDTFPALTVIQLGKPPVQSVTSVKYIAADGSLQTLVAGTDYDVDLVTEPGYVCLALGKSWPTPKQIVNAVVVEFKAGYGDAATAVPAIVKLAMEQMVGHWYEHRESHADPELYPVPATAEFLLSSLRFFTFK